MKLNSLLTAIGFCFLGVVYAQDLSIVVNMKGRVGFSDSNGKEVIKCIYESARPFSDGYAIVMKSGKYGMIDTNGKIVLPLNFNSISAWSDELYLVKSGKMFGLVSHHGKSILPAKYSLISKANCYGKALVAIGGKATVEEKKTYMANAKYGVIDKYGKILITPSYKGLYEFAYEGNSEAVYHTGKRLKYSYHFTTDTLLTDCSYLGISKQDGVSILRCGIVDAYGKEILKQGLYDYVMMPHSNMVRYYIAKKKETICGYHNLNTGKSFQATKIDTPLTEIKYWTHGDFEGDIAPVNGVSWSFVDKTGRTVRGGYKKIVWGANMNLWGAQNNKGTWDVFDSQNKDIAALSGYEAITFPTHEGDQEVLSVRKGSQYGGINRNGNVVIPFEYDDMGANVFDVVAVKRNGKWGIVSVNNQLLIPLEYSSVRMPVERNAQHFWVMKSDSLWYHFHITGQTIYKTGYRATSNFVNGIAMVVPVNLTLEDTSINRAQLFQPNALAADLETADLEKAKDSFGYILRTDDNEIIFNRPVSILYVNSVATAVMEKGNRILTDLEKKNLLLEVTKDNRSYALTGDYNEKFLSYINSKASKRSKEDMKLKTWQFFQDYALELEKDRLSENEWNY